MALICVSLCLGLTHDGDIILDLEQGFLAALPQHAKGFIVAGVVQWHTINAQEAVPGPQRPLSAHIVGGVTEYDFI